LDSRSAGPIKLNVISSTVALDGGTQVISFILKWVPHQFLYITADPECFSCQLGRLRSRRKRTVSPSLASSAMKLTAEPLT
jgi:hypothetical protein